MPAKPRFPLSRRPRRALLVVHVALSVGWFGVTLALLALGITGRFCGDPVAGRAAYPAMRVLVDWVVVPVSLLSLLSGLWLSLATPWGLVRHRWIVVKFWVTLAATAASVLALRPNTDTAGKAVSAGSLPEASLTGDLVVAPSVALATYLFVTAVSVLKPWGPTARELRERATNRPGP